MNPFDLFNQPLKGAHLIEAGAGTGKTYTLTALYLRLVVEQGIGVEQILVVTYTKAATEELKTRIRQRLLKAKKGIEQHKSDDLLLVDLQQRSPSPIVALQRIRDALINFDRAAIHTIHGFCQRILQYFAFETGHFFQNELVQDDTIFVQEAAEDFWRRYIARAPKELAVEALKKFHGPDQLARTFQLCRLPNIEISPDGRKPILTAVRPWRDAAKSVQSQWPQARHKVKELLKYDGLNARTYGNTKKRNTENGLTHRQIKIESLCSAMDHWSGDYPLFEHFELFSSHRIALATNKGKITPQHPFFDICKNCLELHDRLKAQLDAYLGYLKARLIQKARPAIAKKKAQLNVLFFDDLLLLVHRAVVGKNGQVLANAIRSQYRAVLVDEFQDTDQLQYEIFFNLFAQDQHLLTMIGDPKQAIYSFRGADLFSYLQAAGSAKSRTTLNKNWRATPELIKAINTLFADHPKPFGLAGVSFEPAIAARMAPSKLSPALQLWYLPADGEGLPRGGINSGDAVYEIAAAVAQEIVGLLEVSEDGLAPEEIAILVRTHKQAQIVKKALSDKSIPAVLHSAGRIFDTPQAEELERVLLAVATPADPVLVRAALAGSMFGWNASLFMGSLEDENLKWQSQWDRFWRYRRVWVEHGFYTMFRHLMIGEGIKKRVLAYPEGERYMTNLIHLAEILHQAEMAHGLGPDGLIKWLVSKRRLEEAGSDDQQLRLESDARAVRIITMHKSKGLQFEVVFCPYTWAGVKDNSQAALLHDQHQENRLTLALGPSIPDTFKRQARKEALAENLRMLYVALTRARQRCYWVWGRIKGTDLSAPAYLLHGHGIDMGSEGWEIQLKEKMSTMDHAQWVMTLNGLEDRSDGSIAVAPLPVVDLRNHKPSAASNTPLLARTATRHFERHWRIASFSSLTAGRPAQGDGRIHSNGFDLADVSHKTTPADMTLFDFPKGARAGLFFHDLLEHWDHTGMGTQQQEALVSEKLHQHGYEPQWNKVICQMLETLSQSFLTGPGERFTLSQVAFGSRINEMAFYFPLKAVGANQMQGLFQKHTGQSVSQEMADSMGRLNFSPVQGFMKGYIDMVFSHAGRYYLLDWKSNYLGPGHDDYAPNCLDNAMTDSYYFLQYHLYAVALDQLLRRRLDDYDYASDFGGVYYIFLRGLGSAADGSSGIFYDRPDPQLMSDLNRLLVANS